MNERLEQEYKSFTAHTEAPPPVELTDKQKRLLHYIMGISTEAGEMLSEIKAHIFYGRELNEVNILEELGDIQYYVFRLLDLYNVTLSHIIHLNTDKLSKRYPNGLFTRKRANNRDIETELSGIKEFVGQIEESRRTVEEDI